MQAQLVDTRLFNLTLAQTDYLNMRQPAQGNACWLDKAPWCYLLIHLPTWTCTNLHFKLIRRRQDLLSNRGERDGASAQ